MVRPGCGVDSPYPGRSMPMSRRPASARVARRTAARSDCPDHRGTTAPQLLRPCRSRRTRQFCHRRLRSSDPHQRTTTQTAPERRDFWLGQNAPMGDVEVLAWGYGLVEGPRVDADGNLYFSDVHNGGVYRRAPSGTIETVVPKRRGVGGIAFHADGGLVISGRNICHVLDGETRIVFAPDAPGLNDLFVDPKGRVICGHDPLRSVLDRRSAHGRGVLAHRCGGRCDRAVRRHLADQRHRVLAGRRGALPLGHHAWRVGPRLRRR